MLDNKTLEGAMKIRLDNEYPDNQTCAGQRIQTYKGADKGCFEERIEIRSGRTSRKARS